MKLPTAQARTLGQWLLLGTAVGALSGLASAVFLHLLEGATGVRTRDERIVFALPLVGLVLGAIYQRWGASIRGGNNLVIDTVHDGGAQIPLRMAPMVLAGTVLTHLFGGSAGREGTAVQMGASLADALAHRCRLDAAARRQVLAAGIAGGFGSVFGTPIAGAVFGLEVVCIGKIAHDALVPALVASIVGDITTRALGVVHTSYPQVAAARLTPWLAVRWVVLGLAVAATVIVFVELVHWVKSQLERRVPGLPLRMFLGGAAVVLLWRAVGTSDYLGLGVPTIVRAFTDPSLPWYAFALKLVFTAVTVGAGFPGGEVTPLFFIGATLGNAAARVLHMPLGLAAGAGLAALFGAAANAPFALSVMAVELLGANVLPHVLIVTAVAYVASGRRGIYSAQRIARANKWGGRAYARPVALRDVPKAERSSDGAPR